jgi:succinate dehydrogenase/fumarate reductase flavoprotein subunit
LKAGGIGALSGAVTASVLFEESTAYAQQRWDREADVVVVGSGGAACAAAIFAAEAKASVIMLEKAATFGGTTAKSGGIFWIPNNVFMRQAGMTDTREDCLRYLARTAFPTLFNPNDTVRFGLPDDMHDMHVAFYETGAATVDALIAMGFKCHTWLESYSKQPMPDYYAQLPEDKAPRGRGIEPSPVDGASGGASFAKQMRTLLDQRKVAVLMEHGVSRLIVNARGEVVGIEAKNESKTVAVRARKGVIFGTGGFTANADMSLRYLRGPIFGGCGVPTCEGDLITMATAVRAKLSNMNNAWWSSIPLDHALQNRSVPEGGGITPGDSSILVNCEGRRCCNEKIQYNERGQVHHYWDPVRARYPNAIMIMIYDQSCRERFGGTSGAIVRPGLTSPMVISGDTLEQLTAAIEARLARVASKTGNYRLDADFAVNLKATIARYNKFAADGKDLDFHRGESPISLAFHGAPRGNTRANITMAPLSDSGPYYAVLMAAGTLDTKGGPKTNAKSEILDIDEKPIPGLYGAGNCVAGCAGQAYWAGGGTIGPGITFGAIAGKSAAAAPVKQPSAPGAVARG